MTSTASAPQPTLRMQGLHIVTPTTLTDKNAQLGVLIQETVDDSVDMAGACSPDGTGTLNWLFTVNQAASTLTTGPAPTPTDPSRTGYCFFNPSTVSGFSLSPQTTTIHVSGTTFGSAPIPSLTIPIFDQQSPAGVIVLLPLSGAVFKNVTLSSNGDCVGSLDPGALDATCRANPQTGCSKWQTGGTIGGYIKLADADKVMVAPLGYSLCLLLIGARATPGSNATCDATAASSGGDFCSTTQAPGGCGDSMWFAATFAASAVKVDGSGSNPNCE
jgi:hypothetical protein